MDDNYVPRSPDLSGQYDYEEQPLHPQHSQYRGSVSLTSPYTPTGHTANSYFSRLPASSTFHPLPQAAMPPQSTIKDEPMVKREADGEVFPTPRRGRGRAKQPKQEEEEDEEYEQPQSSSEGVEVRTKFPVARIKRIMQADEDVGKVAQVTPVAVAKALELFMISLVQKSAAEAKSRNSRRVLASHLKQAIMSDERFDFLHEIVSKVPDAPAPSAQKSPLLDDDEVDIKPKRSGRRRRNNDSEYS